MSTPRKVHAPFIPQSRLAGTFPPLLPPTDPAAVRWSNYVLTRLNARANQIVSLSGPSHAENAYKRRIIEFCTSLLTNTFDPSLSSLSYPPGEWPEGVHVASYGSFSIRTYITGSDIDLVAYLPSTNVDVAADYVANVHARLESLRGHPDLPFPIGPSVLILQTSVPVCKTCIGGVKVDVSANQPGGPITSVLFERCARCLATPAYPNLFKQTVVLAKCWAASEAHVLGSHLYQLSSYALTTIVLHVFARCPGISSPLHGFALFLEFVASYFSTGQHQTHAIAVQNLVSVQKLRDKPAAEVLLAAGTMPSFLSQRTFWATCDATVSDLGSKDTSGRFAVRRINILDPLNPTNNLARSVSSLTLHRLARAVQLGCVQMRAAMVPAVFGRAPSVASALALLDAIFVTTLARACAGDFAQDMNQGGIRLQFYGGGEFDRKQLPQPEPETKTKPPVSVIPVACTPAAASLLSSMPPGAVLSANLVAQLAAEPSPLEGDLHALEVAARDARDHALGLRPSPAPSATSSVRDSLPLASTDMGRGGGQASPDLFTFAQPMSISPDIRLTCPRKRQNTHSPVDRRSSQPSDIVQMFPAPREIRAPSLGPAAPTAAQKKC